MLQKSKSIFIFLLFAIQLTFPAQQFATAVAPCKCWTGSGCTGNVNFPCSSPCLASTGINGNLSILPTITSSSTVCVNTSTTVIFNAQSSWNLTSGSTLSNAVSNAHLYTYSGSQTNMNVNWLDQTTNNQLYNYLNKDGNNDACFNRYGRIFGWRSTASPPAVTNWPYLVSTYSEYPAGLNYLTAGCTVFPGGPHKANVSLFCHGTASLFGQQQEFLGSSLQFNLYFPQEMTYTLTPQITVDRCMAGIKTFSDNGGHTGNELFYLAANTSAFLPFPGQVYQINAVSPFQCALDVYGVSISPPAPQPGQIVGITYNITNNNNVNLTLTATDLLPPSPCFSNAFPPPFILVGGQMPGPLPFVLQPGQTAQVFLAANTSSTLSYPCTFSVYATANTTQPVPLQSLNCADGTAVCGDIAGYTIQQPSPPWSITCGLVNSTGYLFPGDSVLVQANCTYNGTPSNCPNLTWSENFQNGWLNQTQTPPPIGSSISLNFSTYSPPTGTLPETGTIDISCADPSVCGTASCSVTNINISTIPTDCSLYVFNHSTVFTPGDSALIFANCTTNGTPTTCPDFAWTEDLTYGSLTPTSTPQIPDPNTTFSTVLAVLNNENGTINATSTDPNITLTCLLNVSVLTACTDYEINIIDILPPSPQVGEEVNISTEVVNEGMIVWTKGGNTTITATPSTGLGCLPASFAVPSLNLSESSSQNFSCTCNAPGSYNITFALAEPYNYTFYLGPPFNNWITQPQWECDGNTATAQIFCGIGPTVLTCPDFV